MMLPMFFSKYISTNLWSWMRCCIIVSGLFNCLVRRISTLSCPFLKLFQNILNEWIGQVKFMLWFIFLKSLSSFVFLLSHSLGLVLFQYLHLSFVINKLGFTLFLTSSFFPPAFSSFPCEKKTIKRPKTS